MPVKNRSSSGCIQLHRVIHPKLNLVNVVVRPHLFTKFSLFIKLSLDKEKIMKKGAGFYSLNRVFH